MNLSTKNIIIGHLDGDTTVEHGPSYLELLTSTQSIKTSEISSVPMARGLHNCPCERRQEKRAIFYLVLVNKLGPSIGVHANNVTDIIHIVKEANDIVIPSPVGVHRRR